MKKNTQTKILLNSVRLVQSEVLYKIFQQSMLLGDFMRDLEINLENPIDFAKRLSWLTKGLYVITAPNASKTILGASLVYKKDNQYYYGAAILPTYYSKNVLEQSISQTSALSKYCYDIAKINFNLTVFTLAMTRKIQSSGTANKDERYRILVA